MAIQAEAAEVPAYLEEVVPLGAEIPGVNIDWDNRIKLWNLTWQIAEALRDPSEPDSSGQLRIDLSGAGDEAEREPARTFSVDDLARAVPGAIEGGLYIPRFGPVWQTAEGKVDVPYDFASEDAKNARWLIRSGKTTPIKPSDITIIFPSEEAKQIGYYAKALADRTKTSTRAANRDLPDRDEVNEKVDRSAHHQLEGYVKKMTALEKGLVSERGVLRSLFRDMSSHWQAHYKARNLDKRRKGVEERLHLTVETSATTLKLEDTAVRGLHRAIRHNLYGHLTQDEQEQMWTMYLLMIGRYTTNKLDRLVSHIDACKKEMETYQPAIDRKAQREAGAKQPA